MRIRYSLYCHAGIFIYTTPRLASFNTATDIPKAGFTLFKVISWAPPDW